MENYLLQKTLEIGDMISHHLPDCTAFILPEQTLGLPKKAQYIIAFTSEPSRTNPSNLSNTIFDQSNQTIKPIILLHKLSDLNTKQPHQQRFFSKVIKEGQRICFDKNNYPYLPVNVIPERDFESDWQFWQKCVAVAQFNIHAAKDSEHLEVELCKIALLNTASTQLALGLIRLEMEYTPNEFGLNYLLSLCGYFTDIPSKTFSTQTPENHHRYKMLCTPPSMLNHWTKLNAKESDFQYLLDATEQFFKHANELASSCYSRENSS